MNHCENILSHELDKVMVLETIVPRSLELAATSYARLAEEYVSDMEVN